MRYSIQRIILKLKVKVKFTRYRPQQALGDPEVKVPDFLDFRHYEGGKVVTLTHRPSLLPRVSWYLFSEAESTPGHMVPSVVSEKKSPVTPLGIDPETHRLVAQCLNHYGTLGPNIKVICCKMRNFSQNSYLN
jgi:hypothetical protein